MGRFLTRDTYTGEEDEPLSLHLYTYCENDGVNMTDPTGHWGKANGKYIHLNITRDAFINAFLHISTLKIYNNKKLLKILCDGSILPDFVQSKKLKSYKKKFRK